MKSSEPSHQADAADGDARRAAKAAREAAKAQEAADRQAAKLALAELRGSYYLSGVNKKIDLREIEGFADLARQVMAEGRCGMNYDRLYTLWQAVRGAPAGLPVVEVGTYKGGSARFIAETLRRAGRSPRFYVCDTFSGHARVDPEIDIDHGAATKFRDTSAEAVAAYLSEAPNIDLVVGDIVKTSARLAHERAFGFVHIDVDVYPATDFCLRFFAPRLAPGALMVIDDYGFTTCPGAKKAADEFVADTPAFRLLHLLTGQAVLLHAT